LVRDVTLAGRYTVVSRAYRAGVTARIDCMRDSVTANAPLLGVGGDAKLGRVVVNKTFSKSFRIVLMDKDGTTRIFEVESLAGLRSVVDRVDRGELFEMGKFGAIQMQLWGFLAEHCGFMQVLQPRTMEAGLGVLGPSAALVDDLADLLGGVDAGVEMLSSARTLAGVKNKKSEEVSEEPANHGRQHGVVEVTDEMVATAGLYGPSTGTNHLAEQAAADYKALAEGKSVADHAQDTLAADQAAIDRHKRMEAEQQTRAEKIADLFAPNESRGAYYQKTSSEAADRGVIQSHATKHPCTEDMLRMQIASLHAIRLAFIEGCKPNVANTVTYDADIARVEQELAERIAKNQSEPPK